MENVFINELIVPRSTFLDYSAYCALAVGGFTIPVAAWGFWAKRIRSRGLLLLVSCVFMYLETSMHWDRG